MSVYNLTLNSIINEPPGMETATLTLSNNCGYSETITFIDACTDGFEGSTSITFAVLFNNNQLNICPTNTFFNKVFNDNDIMCNNTGFSINIFSEVFIKITELKSNECINVSTYAITPKNIVIGEAFLKFILKINDIC
jgi:hypothetical protein